MDEDSVLALEQAVYQIDCDSQSSDNEVDPGEEGDVLRPMDNPVSHERTEQHERPKEIERGGTLLPTSSTPQLQTHRALPANYPLNAILSDDQAFSQFRQFLMDQCITRNLNFWMACQSYREMDSRNIAGLAQVASAIYMKFIKLSAPQHVTISDSTKKNVKSTLMFGETPISPYLFDEAQKQIWDVMAKNELRQFLVSDRSLACSVSNLSDMDLYSPGMANPAYGVCGGGSLQNSGSEDSASMLSTDSDAGARSAVFYRSLASNGNTRRAMSDNEGSRTKKRAYPNPYIVEGKPVSREEFALCVHERLQAVFQDREAMTLRARDFVRQQGKTYEEIMAAQWYDLAESCKYLQISDTVLQSRTNPVSRGSSKLQPPSRHRMSPLETVSPSSTLCNGNKQNQKLPEHIKNLAKKEVKDALRDLQITNQVNRKRHSNNLPSGCSSVFSAASDSGVGGDTWATSGIATPTNNRLHAYLQHQDSISSRLPERDRDAQAAAIALISNSPHPDSLSPLPTAHQQQTHHHHQSHQSHHSSDRQRRQNYGGGGGGRYSSGDDSSSVFTVTSQSTTSDLFIPRKTQHHYTDSETGHHFGGVPSRVRRTLTTPKRSHMKNSHAPSPLAEQHRHLPPPSQQPQRPSPSSQPQPTSSGDILIVYDFDLPTPYAKRLSGSEITLEDFKERVFARKGDYRYFFKTYCADLEMEILEEYTSNRALLPFVNGKIVGRVEKI